MTFRADFAARSFPAGSGVPDHGYLRFTEADLMHALFVTGRASGDEWLHGSLSLFEWLHRAAVVPAYLADVRGRVCRTALADSLDRSEKVNLSYAIGQAGTGLFAQQRLGVTRLLHLDRYGLTHGVQLLPTRRRPDLFGLGSGGWVIAESKGLSNPTNLTYARTAKTQAALVSSVGGVSPWCRAGIVTYFDHPSRSMNLIAVDPDEDELARDLPSVTKERFDYAYYAAFMSALGRQADVAIVQDTRYRIRQFEGVGLTLGLRADLYERMQGATGRRAISISEEELVVDGQSMADQRADGSLLHVDWTLPEGYGDYGLLP